LRRVRGACRQMRSNACVRVFGVALCRFRQDKGGPLVDGSQSLMQLPHVDVNHVKKLNLSKIRCGLQCN
jgi:hypothetical protein